MSDAKSIFPALNKALRIQETWNYKIIYLRCYVTTAKEKLKKKNINTVKFYTCLVLPSFFQCISTYESQLAQEGQITEGMAVWYADRISHLSYISQILLHGLKQIVI